jgi:hypothetical protein
VSGRDRALRQPQVQTSAEYIADLVRVQFVDGERLRRAKAVGLFCSVSVIVLATIGRTMLKVAGWVAEVPAGRGLSFLDHPVARLDLVRIGEVVRLRGDLLVGFNGASGSWAVSDQRDATAVEMRLMKSLTDFAGQIRLIHTAHDQRTKRLLTEWRRTQRPLIAAIDPDGLVALIDEHCGHLLLGEPIVLPAPSR